MVFALIIIAAVLMILNLTTGRDKVVSSFTLKNPMATIRKQLKKSVMPFAKFIWGNEYHGQKLLTRKAIIIGYSALYIILLLTLFTNPRDLLGKLSVLDFANREILITTALIALLIPVAVALIQDDGSIDFMRSVVIKDVIRLKGLIFASIILFMYPLVPKYGDIRMWLVPLVVIAWVFFIGSFFRAYFWLIDIVTTINSKDGNMKYNAGPSYRFARVACALLRVKDDRPWMTIWGSSTLPVDFENQLHEYFFTKVDKDLKTGSTYYLADSELEIYAVCFKNRDKNNYWLYNTYIERLLSIYERTVQIEQTDRMRTPWRAQQALIKVIAVIFGYGFERGDDFGLFEAMKKYCGKRGLSGQFDINNGPEDDEIVDRFLSAMFEYIYAGNGAINNVKSNFVNFPDWQVTYNNLYVSQLNISFLTANKYKEWLFAKLGERRPDNLYNVDTLTNTLFPEVDVITFSKMYWFFYIAQNTTDSDVALELYYKQVRPIGHMGGVSATWSTDPDRDTTSQALDRQRSRIESAVKLYATLYSNYLRSFWDIDDLVSTANSILTNNQSNLGDEEKYRLEDIRDVLKMIMDYYNSTNH